MALEEDAQSEYERLCALNPIFPNKFCKIAAIIMSWKGYKIIKGLVHLDNYCCSGKSLEVVHYWNYDPVSGREFDLTAEQFNHHTKGQPLPSVGIWHPEKRPSFYEEYGRDIAPHEVY
ncbi:hypothetical protein JXB28_04955 [Candidatus Woesearchaeota archaeon]|nr:hypothetical protein [Candidatus Woesearchaeota archaeon]